MPRETQGETECNNTRGRPQRQRWREQQEEREREREEKREVRNSRKTNAQTVTTKKLHNKHKCNSWVKELRLTTPSNHLHSVEMTNNTTVTVADCLWAAQWEQHEKQPYWQSFLSLTLSKWGHYPGAWVPVSVAMGENSSGSGCKVQSGWYDCKISSE